MLQVVHQDVQVSRVLSHSPHLAHQLVPHLRHVLDFVEEMLLLLSLQHLLLRDDLDGIDGTVVFLRRHRRLSLVGEGLVE